jgi:deoxyribonuclease V
VKALRLHRWNVTPREAARIQQRLRGRFEPLDRFSEIKTVAGADVAVDSVRNVAIAGVIVYRFPEMMELERVWARRPLTFPYVPGLLSFREVPVLLRAFAKLRHSPDLIFYDGHGYAHPRRFGIATHLGVVLDCPSVGCAKSILVGVPSEPGTRAGSWAPLTHDGEMIAAVLRTREGTKPVYVSQGHRVALQSAIRFARAVRDEFRIPRPTREADRFVGEIKRRQLHFPPGRYNQIKTGGESHRAFHLPGWVG